MKRLARLAAFAASVGIALLSTGGVSAQVSSINGVLIRERVFNDDPTSVLTTVNNYPSLISFDDQSLNDNGVSPSFANRHVWEFSANGGAMAYRFSNNDFFEVFMTVTLTANPISPRKEAGFLLSSIGGQGQFIVNTDAREVVAFGGPFPFHRFPSEFDSGETIRLGMTYFRDTDGKRKIIYHACDQSSPAKEFTNLEQGIINNSTLGGYAQFNILTTNPNNFGTAVYQNISIVALRSISGTIALQAGLEACPLNQPLQITLTPTTGTPITRTVTPAANGSYSFFAPAGDYRIKVKTAGTLSEAADVNTASADVSGVNFTLRGGDINDDNAVDITDLLALISVYNTPAPNDPATDINCDGTHDITDLLILIGNYNALGNS
jgi:hypothetical protein